MGIFDIFSNNSAQQQQQQQQSATTAPTTANLADPNQTTQPTANTPVQPGNLPTTAPSSEPAQPNAAAPVEGTDSPLDAFKDIWEPNKNEDSQESNVALDPSKLQEVVSKADFSSAIPQTTLAAIAEGGEEATAAFAEAMNAMQQQAMVQTLLAANKMTEQAVDKVNAAWESKIPKMLKQQSLNENLAEANPMFSNPAVKPVIEAAQLQLAAKYPDATTAELATMAKDFVTAMGKALVPEAATATSASTGEDSVDWDVFLNGQ